MLELLHQDLFHTVPGALLWLLLAAQGVWMMASALDGGRWRPLTALLGLLLGLATAWGLIVASDWPGLGLLLLLGPAAGFLVLVTRAVARVRRGRPLLRSEETDPDRAGLFLARTFVGSEESRLARRSD